MKSKNVKTHNHPSQWSVSSVFLKETSSNLPTSVSSLPSIRNYWSWNRRNSSNQTKQSLSTYYSWMSRLKRKSEKEHERGEGVSLRMKIKWLSKSE
jgi:hypothetical protein